MAFTYTFILLCIFALPNVRNTVTAQEHCFTFEGDSYLVFSPSDPYDNKNSAHFELEFKTENLNGLLMYARGDSRTNDTEALYVRGGHLHYHIFNTGESGIGRQFGGYFVSHERVNRMGWIKVHVYRSKETASRNVHARGPVWKTGFEFELNGIMRTYVDGYQRHNIDISNSIYLGGYRHSVSDVVGNFTGQIREFKEHTNGHTFENPSLNYKSRVELHCFNLQSQ